MKHKKATFMALLIPLALSVHAQQGTSAAGGDASGSGGTSAYTVGQIVYTTNTGTNGTVSEGVQQPYEILTTEVKETKFGISLTAFPNPTISNLTLQVDNFSGEKLSCSLFDVQGKLLISKTITSKQTQIEMNSLSAATYFISVTEGDNKIQTFKIIKK